MNVLVHDFVEVNIPLERAADLLAAVGDEMGVWAQAAYRRGEQLAIGPGNGVVSAPITLEVGDVSAGLETVTIPMSWRASSAAQLFPEMRAEVVLSPLGPSSTYLEFRGSYLPPLDGFGAMLDRIAFHRIAESTVRGFLERLTSALEAEARAG